MLDISKVSKQSGLAPSALRYYEEKGLIHSIGRQGLRRQYPADVLQRLALIALGREAGFNLDEIGELLGTDQQPEIDRQRLSDKADELDKKIRQLMTMRDLLRHTAACPAENHLACDSFQRMLSLAQKRQQKRRST